MNAVRIMASSAWIALNVAAFVGCEKKSEQATPSGGAQPQAGHSQGSEAGSHAPGHGGTVIELGAITKDGFAFKATRDEGQIVAGKDAPIDVTITPGAGETRRVLGVRFWIGLQDAKGSVKAKAEVEDPKDSNRWHTHAEIPKPLPAGSMLWVEVETDKSEKIVVSFELRA